MKTLTAIAALAGVLSFAAAAPAFAQAHGDHGQAHGAAAAHAHAHADFESGRFHVRIDGPEHPVGDVILIPGLSSSPHVWDELTEQLKGRYRVHRIHVQGFAGAPVEDNASGPVSAPVAEDLARYIAEQGLNRPAVIGHSMGGTIGLMLAARHPDSVGRLMVVDMVPFMGAMFGPPGTTAESVAPMADQIHGGMTAASDEQYQQQAAASVTGMINTEALRARPLQDAARSDRAVSSAAFRELIVTDLRSEIGRITAPTRVLYVKFNDPRMTDEITDSIYQASFAALPGATLTRIDDSAHFIMLDQPARFAAEVNAFLE
ncbi:MAG: alpha/beta hydrolase [Brevundimonas sp.]|uniref:alpha/beta fold hydrolase n=1 Tax=Brevundimonas sp. TaxID=1871086 RepID=UPI002723F989|nr:alpha/beta hydrolase [Brevundimonas sp.]MDO9587444.1 alpha/beta hydrolase [Brevundimonas sp.]MDP3655458.1 alpha/beta hydrolase [Brevundimonas sp.]MDZ4111499.1 alpha/beta hydrolase [Brevundimonas sp.]MDZ4318298.1 alpha/beta hydrolase [Phenylobacterium sp.]